MNQDEFYHTSDIQKAKSFFISDGWVIIYSCGFSESNDSQTNWKRVYGYMVDNDKIEKCMSSYKPDIEENERTVVYDDYIYKSFSKDGIEPLVVVKSFYLKDGTKHQIRVSEEIIFYFNLYEECEDELTKIYYYVENGNKTPVIRVTQSEVKIKQKFLLEYIAIRKKHYVLSFRFESEVQFSQRDKLDFNINYTPNGDIGIDDRSDSFYINSLVRPCSNLIQSWQQGKAILKHRDIKDIGCHFDGDRRSVDFIVGYDNETGNNVELSTNEDSQHYFTPVFFQKKVLDKYYSDPTYKVEAMRISDRFFSLKCDNDNSNYVVAFFNDLSQLPYVELLHWKGHNIAPDDKMKLSRAFYNSMILGNWSTEAGTPDLFFKQRFVEFTGKWNCKFKWDLFKPLSDIQKHVFTGLHIPTTENISTFINQIEGLTLILIDSLNDKEISKYISIEEKERSISKLNKYLSKHNCPNTEIIEFFRNLQSLRSGITKTHRFSERKSTDAIKAMKHFGIEDDLSNCIKSSEKLFMDSIYTLNTLMVHFNL